MRECVSLVLPMVQACIPAMEQRAAAGYIPAREQMVAGSSHGPERENTIAWSVAVVFHFSIFSLSSTHYYLVSNKWLSIVSAPEWEILH